MSRRPVRDVLEDAHALAVRTVEAFADGDTLFAEQLADGLVRALEDALYSRPRRPRCSTCGLSFQWPGQLAHHQFAVHGETLRRSRAA